MLKILTFGGLKITLADQTIDNFITRKVEALLIYLLCNPREHSREYLGNFLWEDLPQNRVMGNLRTVISNLKQELGDYVAVTRHSVAFDPAKPTWTDAAQLERAIQQAEQHHQTSGTLTPGLAKQLAEAFTLYRGDFLQGFHIKDAQGFEEWKSIQQERYRQEVIRASQWLIDYQMAQQQYTEAIAHATRLLDINPLLEEGHRYMMQLYHLTGQRSAALKQYNKCVDILRKELNVAPDPKTIGLHEQILAGEMPTPAPLKTPHNLSTPTTPFVPRPEVFGSILDSLRDSQCSLLTLVGMGGIGKTRLALEAGHALLDSYPDGVYFIDLVGVGQPQFFAAALVNALKIPVRSDESLQQDMLTFLQGKRMLLIFDNFEHLLDATDVIDTLLTRAPTLNMLVTSREKLNLHGEWALYIEGLPLPNDPQTLEKSSAAQLFLNTARRLHPNFKLAGNEAAIVQICQLVEGLPLALELAAAWTHLMSCAQIVAQIQADLNVLNAPLKNLPPRHRSIWQLFEYSWQHLTPNEQHALMKLSLFRNRFNPEAAQQVGQASYLILRTLSDKCLIKVAEPGWYVIHSLLKQFVADKLAATELHAAAVQYAGYFLAWIQHEQNAPHDVDVWYDDIRAAMDWAGQHDTSLLITFCTSLDDYWYAKGYLSEARYWLELALARPDISEKERALALSRVGRITWAQGDFDIAHQYMVEAVPLLEQYQRWEEYTRTLNHLGHLALNRGDYATARAYYERLWTFGQEHNNEEVSALGEGNLGLLYSDMGDFSNAIEYLRQAVETYRRLQRRDRITVLLTNLGTVALHLEQYEDAQAHYEEAYALAQEIENQMLLTICQVNLGEVLHHLKDYQAALRYYRDGLKSLITIGDKLSIIGTLESIAYLLIDLNQAATGVQILGAMATMRMALGAPIAPREKPREAAYRAQAAHQLSEADYKAASAKGERLSLEEVTAFVLEM